LNYHNEYEKREYEYRMDFNLKKKKTQITDVEKFPMVANLINYPDSLKFRLDFIDKCDTSDKKKDAII